MRILLIIHTGLTRNSGAGGVVLSLADAYAEAGHAVRVLSYDDMPDRLGHKAKEALFPWFVARKLPAIVRDWRPDVIDASTGDAWVWARLIRRRRAGGPLLVTHSHGLEHGAHALRLAEAEAGRLNLSWRYPLYYGGLRLWEVATSLRVADAVFLLNREDRAYATERLGVEPSRAHVVRNGVSGALIGQPPPGPADGPLRVAQVGTYLARKGVHYGAEALRQVMRGRPEVRMTFLGAGCPRETVLDDFPADLHDRVEVVPSYEPDELAGLLRGHHIKLFPTLFEGLGVALLEAMACGLAPVTTRVAGPLEIVRDGENGLLVAPADAPALAAALERLVADPRLLARLRTRAWETAQEFTWEHAAAQRLELYREARRLRHGAADVPRSAPAVTITE